MLERVKALLGIQGDYQALTMRILRLASLPVGSPTSGIMGAATLVFRSISSSAPLSWRIRHMAEEVCDDGRI